MRGCVSWSSHRPSRDSMKCWSNEYTSAAQPSLFKYLYEAGKSRQRAREGEFLQSVVNHFTDWSGRTGHLLY
jgi:hypothetical protein